MNGTQFLERWPAKPGRLFLFGGGKDHDRLALFYTVCDFWRKKVGEYDFVRLHAPTFAEINENCRADPLVSKYRVVCATEFEWPDPEETDDAEEKAKRRRQFDSLRKITANLPRDLVLIMSTTHENPLTKNDLAQSIITKGYWVVLKNVDVETASNLLAHYTDWDEDLRLEVVESIGTSLSELLSFLRVLRIYSDEPKPEDVRSFLTGYVRGTVFDLTDAISMKDAPRALALAQDDIPLGPLIGSLDRKLTSLLQFMAEMRQGRTPKEAALALRLPGFIVHGLFEASKRWSPGEILSVYPTLAAYSARGHRPGAVELLVADVIGIT